MNQPRAENLPNKANNNNNENNYHALIQNSFNILTCRFSTFKHVIVPVANSPRAKSHVNKEKKNVIVQSSHSMGVFPQTRLKQ